MTEISPSALQPSDATYRLALIAVLTAMATFVGLQMAAFGTAGGVFEYPLDDPYIHMAMAEQILDGGYGVNAGEYAAAASSALYPLLLLPFAGEEMQRYVPLFWNVVGLIASAALWGQILWRGGFAGPLGVVLAIVGPLALNIVGVAFLGMEHSLHVATSLAVIAGLITFVETGRIGWLLILGIVLGPLLRFEGVALSLAAAGIVMVKGRIGPSFGLAFLAVLPLAGFAAYLLSLGLEPLPSSVTAKLKDPGQVGEPSGYLQFDLARLLGGYAQRGMLAFVVVGLFLLAIPQVHRSHMVWVLVAALAATMAHIAFGKFGWLNRYEIYAFAIIAAAVFIAANQAGRAVLLGLPLLALVYIGLFYGFQLTLMPRATAPIHLQQAQMSRFAKNHLDEPVAVNDLGWVAWRNPHYVLDLWGLANHEARQARLSDQPDGWAGALAEERSVKVAMVYDRWLGTALGPGWQRLGVLSRPRGWPPLGEDHVAFLLAPGIAPEPYLQALKDWAADLPDPASFTFAPEFAP
ncbi:MAG: hypothetical protein AAFQ66_10610 [Pseudomonadota bacterium]